MMKDYNYKICFIGMPGAGKTTIGREISNKINYTHKDLDQLIINDHKLPIKDIFKQKGEEYFRKIETFTLKKLINSNDKLVISTGGGVIQFNKDSLKKTYNIYLKCNIPTLMSRLKKSNDRPLIGSELEKNIKDLLLKRERLYSNLSNLTIDATDFKKNTIDDILKKIKL